MRGLELEANAAITNTLVVDLSLGVTDSEFDDQLIEIAQGTFADIGGNQVQRTPDLTYAIGLTKDWNLASGASIQLRIEHSFTDEIFYSALNGVAGDGEAGGSDLAEDYTNTNLRIFYHSADDRWTFELAATNLTDEVQEGNVFRGIGFLDIPGGGGPEEVTYNSPRLISGRIAYRF